MKHYLSLKTTPKAISNNHAKFKKSNSVDFHISNPREACISYCLLLNGEQRLFIIKLSLFASGILSVKH